MKPPKDAVLVSITDSARPDALLQPGWDAILRLRFDDVDELTFPGMNADLRPMSRQQALDISVFVRLHLATCSRFVVHCRHGVSRSSAVAKAISAYAEAPFPDSYVEYNRFVFQMICRALP